MLSPLRRAQAGVILVVALIVLVAMTLASLSLVRSIDTANIISGNLAFQQAATHSGDTGTETAVAWLEANNSGSTLWNSNLPQGYVANRQDPATGQTWEAYWTVMQSASPSPVVTLSADASGNTVSYVIHRLCANAGIDPASTAAGCAVAQGSSTTSGSSKGSGFIALQFNSQVYYRITTRIAGPHNTVSFIQTIVAL